MHTTHLCIYYACTAALWVMSCMIYVISCSPCIKGMFLSCHDEELITWVLCYSWSAIGMFLLCLSLEMPLWAMPDAMVFLTTLSLHYGIFNWLSGIYTAFLMKYNFSFSSPAFITCCMLYKPLPPSFLLVFNRTVLHCGLLDARRCLLYQITGTAKALISMILILAW